MALLWSVVELYCAGGARRRKRPVETPYSWFVYSPPA